MTMTKRDDDLVPMAARRAGLTVLATPRSDACGRHSDAAGRFSMARYVSREGIAVSVLASRPAL